MHVPTAVCQVLSPYESIDLPLIDSYILEYAALTGGSKTLKGSNLRFAKKLAAINLIKESKGTRKNPTEGFVYVITNPAWPTKAKVGFSFDPLTRLAEFNTADPFRQYKLECWAFFSNARENEKYFHSKYKENRLNEWVDLIKYPLDYIKKDIMSRSLLY